MLYTIVIVFDAAILSAILLVWKSKMKNCYKAQEPYPNISSGPDSSWDVSSYMERIEQVYLEILEQEKPVYQSVTLWLGLDGLTLDENGEMKWISRKKPEPINQNVFYQPIQSVLFADNYPQFTPGMIQSSRATIDGLHLENTFLQMQTAQQAQMQNVFSQINYCCVQSSMQNHPYYPCSLY